MARQVETLEWRLGGGDLAAAAVANCFVVMHLNSLGMFMEPLQHSFGWSRTFISSGLALQSIVVLIGSPLLGMLIDRVGPRPIAVVGIALYFASFGALSLMTGSTALYFALWFLLALTNLSVKTTVWIVAIVRSFVRHRGLAIAIVTSGISVGAIAVPAMANFFIERFGWRGGYIGLATAGFLISSPLVFLLFGRKHAAAAPAPSRPKPAAPLRRELLSASFIRLAAIASLVTVWVIGTSIHLVPIAAQFGVGRGEAGGIAGLFGATSLIGRLATGTMIDRWRAKVIGAVVMSLGVAGALLLAIAHSSLSLWLAAGLVGVCLGAEIDVVAYLTARIFKRDHFATLFGVIVGLITLCTGVGPLIAASVFDNSGSYNLWFWAGGAALALSALLIATLDDRPFDGTASPTLSDETPMVAH